MKRYKILTITISLMVLMTMILGCSQSEGLFPDNNLEKAVRTTLGQLLLLGEEITTDDLAYLARLSAGDNNITDLSGIEYCINLNELELPNNKISDIYPILSLGDLVTLNLENNQIAEIPAPCSFFLLVALNLDGNQIDDLSHLNPLFNIAILSISDNQITDISPLISLINLTRLNLSGNEISDLSPLVENSGLSEGDKVWLQNNNLDLAEGSEDMLNIKVLQDRGVEVNY